MGAMERFAEYAAAFEDAYKTDDWSVLEPFFSEDAVYAIEAGPPLGGRHEGRDAVLAYMKQSVDAYDRRFDSRELGLLKGPELREGNVWMHWQVTYSVAGAPPLVVEGEEEARFEGDRIAHLEDRYTPEQLEKALAFLRDHGDKLK